MNTILGQGHTFIAWPHLLWEILNRFDQLLGVLDDEPCVNDALFELFHVHDEQMVRDSGRHSRDDALPECALHPDDGFLPRLRPDNQLAQQRVVIRGYLSSQIVRYPPQFRIFKPDNSQNMLG